MWKRPIKALVKEIDQMEGSPIVRGGKDQEKLSFKKDFFGFKWFVET